jgi:pimeloyl-ACP methyl ester carboxylesterase
MKRWLLRITATALLLLFLAGVSGVGLLHYLTRRTPGTFFDSGGARIHYTDEGAGEPVLLIHGMGAQADLNWRAPGIINLLKQDFRVVAFDLRGHGFSQKSHEPSFYGMNMVEDIARLMDHLGIPKAHLAGYSLGGFILLKMAATHPERVQSAAICAAGWVDPASVKDRGDILSPYRPPPPMKQAGLRPRPAFAAVLPFPNPVDGTVNWVRDYVGRRFGDKNAFKACKKQYMDLIVTREDLARLSVPMICFMGTNDGLRPYGEALRDAKPEARYVSLPGAGHISTATNADFKQGLVAFFKAHPMSAPATVAGTVEQTAQGG